MITKTAKNRTDVLIPAETLENIFDQLRLIREEIMFLIPQEDLEEYEHPGRIKKSYQKAIKQYPIWK